MILAPKLLRVVVRLGCLKLKHLEARCGAPCLLIPALIAEQLDQDELEGSLGYLTSSRFHMVKPFFRHKRLKWLPQAPVTQVEKSVCKRSGVEQVPIYSHTPVCAQGSSPG